MNIIKCMIHGWIIFIIGLQKENQKYNYLKDDFYNFDYQGDNTKEQKLLILML